MSNVQFQKYIFPSFQFSHRGAVLVLVLEGGAFEVQMKSPHSHPTMLASTLHCWWWRWSKKFNQFFFFSAGRYVFLSGSKSNSRSLPMYLNNDINITSRFTRPSTCSEPKFMIASPYSLINNPRNPGPGLCQTIYDTKRGWCLLSYARWWGIQRHKKFQEGCVKLTLEMYTGSKILYQCIYTPTVHFKTKRKKIQKTKCFKHSIYGKG